MGETVTPETGADGDGDGFVGLHDYGVWKTNFGWSSRGRVRGRRHSRTLLSITRPHGLAGPVGPAVQEVCG
jgi:hypothetical protein